jgi:adenylate cyclase
VEPQHEDRRLITIVAADVVGYSRLMAADESGTFAQLKAHRKELLDPKTTEYRGRTVKLMGDGALMEFGSVVDAVNFAVDVQRAMTERNTNVPEDRRIIYRIGINIGDIIVEGDDIYGDGVNVAARLEAAAEPGGICISAAVHDQIKGKTGLSFDDGRLETFKNLATPIQVYRWRPTSSESDRILGSVGGSDLSNKPAIAVLPFNNLSGDPEQEHFADGMTEDIITALSRLRWFLVIARNTTFVYKHKARNIKQIAHELDVDYVLEGSVRKSGNRIRVAAQLIDANSGAHIWAQNYDRQLTDIFELQDDITQSVTAAIEPQLMAAEGLRTQKRSPEDLGAWQLVMRGLTYLGRMNKNESLAAIELLRSAVRQYPDYGPAHSLLAFVLLISGQVGWTTDGIGYGYQLSDDLKHEAATLARRALQLDYDDPWAHFALGNCCFAERRTEEAVNEYLKAIDLNPNFAIAYGSLGRALVFDGQYEDAISYFQKAFRMSPHDPLIAVFYSGMCTANYYAHRYDEAIEWGRKAIRERPGYTAAHRILCASLAMAGRTDDTEAAAATLRQLQPNISIAWIKQHVPYTPQAMPHFLDGMRKAGFK